MALSRSRLCEMKEAELRTEVLIPLFKAMGYEGVQHYHGGPGEKGKDITMWMLTPFGDREYYAVVVKATPITGSTGSVGEVSTQVCQALGSDFIDTSDLTDHRATKCVVVTPHEIKKEAADAIRAAIRDRVSEGAVRFLHGDELWALIEKHSPEKVVAGQLLNASTILENLDPHHRVTARIKGGQVELGLEPKAPGVPPPVVKAEFDFPDTAAGNATRTALEDHLRRGLPTTIPGEFIRKIELPAPLSGIVTIPITEMRMGPLTGGRTIDVSVAITTPSGETVTLPGLRFSPVRAGTDEVVVTNISQDVPWHFELTLNKATNTIGLSLNIRIGTSNAKRESEAAHFQKALAEGGTLEFIYAETGAPFASLDVPAGSFTAPALAWIALVDSIVFLQQRTGVLIPLPIGAITIEAARDAVELASLMRAGFQKSESLLRRWR